MKGAGDTATVPAAIAQRGVAISESVVNALPLPAVVIGPNGEIRYANDAAEAFFAASRNVLQRNTLDAFVPFGSPILALVKQVQDRLTPVHEYKVDLTTPRSDGERVCDIYSAPLPDMPGATILLLQERSIADKFDRQLTHRGAARSVTGLAAMLAHEIKNPLSGIRGAAQLLESTVGENDRVLTQLIRDEADRIVKLVDRMEVFSDERPIDREPVNIHRVLEHVRRIARNGFAQHIKLTENYDPSLPPVWGNRDQLVQVFLNLVKNAAEAIGPNASGGEIVLSTAFRPGVRMSVPGTSERISLPLEFCVDDNGPGIANELVPHLFDPFVTTKSSGSGLGLALVAKVIGDHGGVIDCKSQPGKTRFRILLPQYVGKEDAEDVQDEAETTESR
ncbi:two-component system sensor histidine kinase NtrB [Tepidamorphus sp. 3E244]|uniref:two-component system sensor histidine kinase NtrB n=1 Tax=Tepidamorphus sp. 3E244 TaxID=3385498 RepID=UPI0038FC7DE2